MRYRQHGRIPEQCLSNNLPIYLFLLSISMSVIKVIFVSEPAAHNAPRILIVGIHKARRLNKKMEWILTPRPSIRRS